MSAGMTSPLAVAEPRTLVAVEVPAPRVPVEALWALDGDRDEFRFVWDPPSEMGSSLAASGIAAVVRGAGPGRFAALREQGSRLLAEVGGQSSSLRLVGGLAFDIGAADDERWQGFGDGAFVLPRWTYHMGGDGARLVGVLDDEAGDPRREASVTADRLADAARRLTERRPRGSVESPDRAAWSARVRELVAAIHRGELAKVVLADRWMVRLAEGCSALDLLIGLRRPGRSSTRFGCAFGATAFVGASPERLVRVHGLGFETEALAGSIGTGASAAAILSGSVKDREEHQFVIDAIVHQLRQVSTRLEVAAEPQVSTLSHLQHLRTPITGTLAAPRHVLSLAEMLHPTPAVGGVPNADALAWIRAREPHRRGWYAGPLGWFDAAGNGELLVALRSALVRESIAEVWAGAGIVRGSDPEAEYEEAELKTRTVLAAMDAGES